MLHDKEQQRKHSHLINSHNVSIWPNLAVTAAALFAGRATATIPDTRQEKLDVEQ